MVLYCMCMFKCFEIVFCLEDATEETFFVVKKKLCKLQLRVLEVLLLCDRD